MKEITYDEIRSMAEKHTKYISEHPEWVTFDDRQRWNFIKKHEKGCDGC